MYNLITITGFFMGLAIGIGASIPKEEKVKQASIIGFSTIIVAIIGGGWQFYGPEQLNSLAEFLFPYSFGFIISFLIGLRYRKWTAPKPFTFYPSIATVGRRAPDETEYSLKCHGVNWIAYIPSQTLTHKEYVVVEGPFCPKCNSKLRVIKKFIRRHWFCKRCNEKYDRPKEKEAEIKRDIEDFCYSDIYRKKKFER